MSKKSNTNKEEKNGKQHYRQYLTAMVHYYGRIDANDAFAIMQAYSGNTLD